MDEKDFLKVHRNIRYIANRINSLEMALSELNIDIKIKWDEFNMKLIQEDFVIDELNKKIGD